MDFFDYIKDNKILMLIISIIVNIILITLLIILFINIQNKNDKVYEKETLAVSNEKVNEEDEFYVEIKGAVKNPNVYRVNGNSIIKDLIELAGGFNKDAYTNNINLSKKVSNELVVYVYTKSEYKKNNTKIEYINTCESSSYDITNCLNNKQSEIVSSDKDTLFIENNNESKIININTASKDELLTLTGIGESKADAIISYRQENGLFKSIEEIMNVTGIGNSLYEKIKNNIRV